MTVSRDELEKLITRAKKGELDKREQAILAEELNIYRRMALRLENAVHDLIKASEEQDKAKL